MGVLAGVVAVDIRHCDLLIGLLFQLSSFCLDCLLLPGVILLPGFVPLSFVRSPFPSLTCYHHRLELIAALNIIAFASLSGRLILSFGSRIVSRTNVSYVLL